MKNAFMEVEEEIKSFDNNTEEETKISSNFKVPIVKADLNDSFGEAIG